MQDNYRNICKIGRQTAGMTQERWAEAIDYLRSCRVPLPVVPVRQKSKNPCGYYPGMKVV